MKSPPLVGAEELHFLSAAGSKSASRNEPQGVNFDFTDIPYGVGAGWNLGPVGGRDKIFVPIQVTRQGTPGRCTWSVTSHIAHR